MLAVWFVMCEPSLTVNTTRRAAMQASTARKEELGALQFQAADRQSGQSEPVTERRVSPLKMLFFGRVPLAVAASLRDEPDAWVGDAHRMGKNYELTHRSGVVLWVANSAYGVEVRTPGGNWGGVNGLSAFGLSPGHWCLWAAAKRWMIGAGQDIDSLLRTDAGAAR